MFFLFTPTRAGSCDDLFSTGQLKTELTELTVWRYEEKYLDTGYWLQLHTSV